MSDLGAIFRHTAANAGRPRTSVAFDDPGLDARLRSACARGRTAFPRLVMDDETFVRHLARCSIRSEEGLPPLEDLAVEDLYLACACLGGVPGAAATFDARCGAQIRASLSALSGSAVDSEEIQQQLRVALLMGKGDAPPRLADYLGLGPLARWAGVVAQRLAFSALRSTKSEASARERSAVEAAFDWKDPAIILMKDRYRGEFQRALEEAMSSIPDRDRLLLRMHLANGMTTRSIGKVYNVDHSTVARWISDARQQVAEHVQRLLRERLSLSPDDVRSIANLMASQLDVSISLLLQSRR